MTVSETLCTDPTWMPFRAVWLRRFSHAMPSHPLVWPCETR